MRIFTISLFTFLLYTIPMLGQFAEPAVTGANFVPNEIEVGQTSTLTVSFANSGSTPIPAQSIELTISTAPSFYTTDGTTIPGGVGGALFDWVYLGTDVWRGTNIAAIPAFSGGDITLIVSGNAVSSAFETTNINVQPVASFTDFADSPNNNNLQPRLRVNPMPPVDTDGDGIADVDDLDDDNDGIPDVDEIATVNNGGDTDGDGIPDILDLDSDNDGIPDVVEAGGDDPDGDGIIGTGTPTDMDMDGLADEVDEDNGGTPLPIPDTDMDGNPDFQDLDSDNDSINDVIEGGGEDPDDDGVVGTGSPTDTDMDGLADEVDGDGGGTPISEPTDTDMDGMPDFQDIDSDDDGTNDIEENGNGDADMDGDGMADGGDMDEDGIPDIIDSDNAVFGSPNNVDTDGDGVIDSDELGGIDGIVSTTNDNTDPNDPCDLNIEQVTVVATSMGDCDMDGISDADEINGMDGNPLTQGDNSDPLDACSPDATNCGNCISINTFVWLEGAYDNGRMHTKLNDLRYLPGQDPTTFLGIETPAGQPYNTNPWNYTGTEGQGQVNYPPSAVDWVLISLRTNTAVNSTVCTRAGLLHDDGSISFEDGNNCCDNLDINQSYFVVIEHRNHLLVMSDEPVSIEDGSITYDFRTQESYINSFGFGQKQIVPGIYTMFAGNGDQDVSQMGNRTVNIIDSDKNKWLSQNGNHSSYYLEDFDLNGDVNVQDKNLWLQNNGVFSDVPAGN